MYCVVCCMGFLLGMQSEPYYYSVADMYILGSVAILAQAAVHRYLLIAFCICSSKT
jgi:hypothetical protein